MKKIILIRHAKSSWKKHVTDFERPLKKIGFEDAKLVSSYIKNKINSPDLILSSDAKRAKTTAEIFIKNLNLQNTDFQLNDKLYDFSGSNLVEVIKNCNDAINHLIIFGHNHAITAFVNTYGSIYYDNVPTCGLITIELDILKWKNLISGKTILKVFPKDLK